MTNFLWTIDKLHNCQDQEDLKQCTLDIKNDVHDKIDWTLNPEMLAAVRRIHSLKNQLLTINDTIKRSGFDTSPCRDCGLDTLCIPDGLPYCTNCVPAN